MSEAEDLIVILADDHTQHPCMAVRVMLPEGTVLVLAQLIEEDGALIARGLHIQPETGGIAPNRLGFARLRALVHAMMEAFGYDDLIVEGAPRTTGAGPGHQPRPLRFTRRLRAEHRARDDAQDSLGGA